MKTQASQQKKRDIEAKKKHKLLLYAIVIALFILFVAVLIKDTYKKNQINQAALHLKKGETAFYNGDYEAAIKSFKKSVKLNPTYRAYNGLASSYAASGKKVLAIEYYSKSLSLNSHIAETHRLLGKLFYDSFQYELAIAQYKKATELAPEDYMSNYWLARSYYRLGNYKEAIRYYNQSMNIRPSESASQNMGILYYYLRNYDDAIKHLSKAHEINPMRNLTANFLASTYLLKEDYDSLLKLADETLSRKPADYNMYRYLGIAYFMKNELGMAIDSYKKSISFNPPNDLERLASTNAALGLAYLRSEEYDKAIEHFEIALRHKQTPAIYGGLAAAYSILGDINKSSENLKKMEDITGSIRLGSPIAAADVRMLGLIYWEHKLYDEAIKHYQIAISLNPSSSTLYHELGKIYLEVPDKEKAIDSFKKSLELDSSNAEAKKTLSQITA